VLEVRRAAGMFIEHPRSRMGEGECGDSVRRGSSGGGDGCGGNSGGGTNASTRVGGRPATVVAQHHKKVA
jgi:hypothetical protein